MGQQTTIKAMECAVASVRELAERDEISVNQFIAAAVSEKMASVMTVDYLKQEAAKGNRRDFDRFLNLVPNKPPTAGDEMPNH